MGIVRSSDAVVFSDNKVGNAWRATKESDPELAKQLNIAKKNLMENAFCGIQIPKELIPETYIKKYGVTNLWKYNLPNAWRLIYSVTTPTKIEIISVVLEWMNHKNYERRFKYS